MASTIAMRAASRQRQFLADFKESFKRVVQGFWSSLQQRACNSSGSCIPLLTRKNGHFSSLVNGIATWPRLASRRSRERSSPNAQPRSSRPDCGYSLSFPGRGAPSASLDVTQPHRKFDSNIFKTWKQTSFSRGNEEEVHVGMSTASQNMAAFFNVSPDNETILLNGLNEIAMGEDSKMYILDGILEVQRMSRLCAAPETPHEDARFEYPQFYDSVRVLTPFASELAEPLYGAGDSSITTVSENETASTAASQELQKPGVQTPTRQFKGIRPKDNRWISEIRPPGAKKTVWLGTFGTPEEAARAYDAGIFYYHKYKIPYNFPDSPELFPTINEGPKEVSVDFVKTQAKRNAERAWPSGAPKFTSAIPQHASSPGSSGGCQFRTCKRRKSNCE